MNSSTLLKKKINHVAIIMDGNGRWAKKNKFTKKIGHENGIKNCIYICERLRKLKYKVNEISFYVFSTENWKRDPAEIKNLFKLIEMFYEEFRLKADKNNLRVRHYGSRNKISKTLYQHKLQKQPTETNQPHQPTKTTYHIQLTQTTYQNNLSNKPTRTTHQKQSTTTTCQHNQPKQPAQNINFF